MKKLILTLISTILVLYLAQCTVPELLRTTGSNNFNLAQISSFSFNYLDNPYNSVTKVGLNASAYGSITNNTNGNSTIKVTLPTDVSLETLKSLKASFTVAEGNIVTINNTKQDSGKTSNDFSTSVLYTVTSPEGKTNQYEVTVNCNNPIIITNPELTWDLGTNNDTISGVILSNTIRFIVPFHKDFAGWKPDNKITFDSNCPADSLKVTWVDFFWTTMKTTEKGITLVLNDDNTILAPSSYNVVITMLVNDKKEIIKFGFKIDSKDVWGIITGKYINVGIPLNTDRTTLIPTFQCSDDDAIVEIIENGNATTQTSGATSQDFTNPVNYWVTAEDGSKTDYTVSVFEEPTFTSFLISSQDDNPIIGIINDDSITLMDPNQAGSSVLTLTFTLYPVKGTVHNITDNNNPIEVKSGETTLTVGSPYTYKVTHTDSTIQAREYTINFESSGEASP